MLLHNILLVKRIAFRCIVHMHFDDVNDTGISQVGLGAIESITRFSQVRDYKSH